VPREFTSVGRLDGIGTTARRQADIGTGQDAKRIPVECVADPADGGEPDRSERDL
jgi:hypothetical protein